jgi:phage shock protein C
MNIEADRKNSEGPKPLRRSVDRRMLGGVASGLAGHFALDVNFVRVVVALSFLSGAGVALYLAAWLLIPEEGSDASIADGLFSRAVISVPR